MQLLVNDLEPQYRVSIRPDRRMTDDEFFNFCAANPNLRMERTAEGEIVIMAGTGWETSTRNSELTAQLNAWAKRDGRGRAADSNAEYKLPNGATRSPDASWVDRSHLKGLTREEMRKFPPLCPDFVVELTSPSDRLRSLQRKMREWMANGTQLGWLLDADKRTAYVYRPGQDPERLVAPERLVGEGPVAGFVLELADIWDPGL